MDFLMQMQSMLGAVDPLSGVRKYLEPILIVLMVVLAIAVTVVILMQKSTSDNIGTIAGGNNDSSLDGKNKTRSKDKTLKITTLALGVCLVIVSVVFFVITSIS